MIINQTVEIQSYEICDAIYKPYNWYVERVINLFGLILNSVNTIVYLRLIENQRAHDDMFRYLLFKSVIDAFYSLRQLIFIFYDSSSVFGLHRFLVAMYFYLIFVVYAGDIAQLMSIFCEVGACLSRYHRVYGHYIFISK